MLFAILKRYVLTLILVIFSCSCFSQDATPSLQPLAASKENVQILVLGDSLSAEFGIERGTGWVSLLEVKLGLAPRTGVINASISGETTSGGRSRLVALLAKYRPKVLVIELGANDALRGLPIETSQANLDWMVSQAVASNSKVLIVGNLVPANYGAKFNKDLSTMYAQVARKYKVGLVPFMLKGIADAPNAGALFQADQLHPLAQAHPTILGNIWPELKKLI